ncbi:MAG TPA: phosphohistidine phosphatase SixA [Candidatus Acidoferrum sp.]|nr:phosphohistidine phosphatase SixA [Candidatus Acidoferrum sp.]
MVLYIVRHGIAVDKTDPKAPPDPERPLTAKGIQKTRAAALGLKELGVKPEVLITSPYVRAAQTAEIFAEALGFATAKIRVTDSLRPSANPADFIREISHVKGKEVMCFGHAPHLDQLISQMVGARGVFTELKKAGIACLEHTSTHSTWRMISILTPKVLRQLA